MRFWFEHSSEVSLRDQIATQVTLGILSGELLPGERLPSIRELARRYKLHPNTVSAGYQQLEAEGWVTSRKGSGVFVRERTPEPRQPLDPAAALDRLLATLFDGARRFHIDDATLLAAIQTRIQTRIQQPGIAASPPRLILVEPDPDLRAIVHAELVAAIPQSISTCGFGQAAALCGHAPALLLVLPSKLETVRAEIRSAALTRVHVQSLRVRSVPQSIAEWLPSDQTLTERGWHGRLIGLASRWPEFLRFSRTMLIAAGIAPDALIVRDGRDPNWQHGLDQAAVVLCDVLTAQALPHLRTIVFRVLADGVSDEVDQQINSYPGK